MSKQLLQSMGAILILTGMHFASGMSQGLEQSAVLEQLMLTDMNPWMKPAYCPNRESHLQDQMTENREQALAQLTADLQGAAQQPTLPPLPALQIGALNLESSFAAVAKPRRPLLDLNFLHFSLRK